MKKTSPTPTNVYIRTSWFSFEFKPKTPSATKWSIVELRSDIYRVERFEQGSKIETFTVAKMKGKNEEWNVSDSTNNPIYKKVIDYGHYSEILYQFTYCNRFTVLSGIISVLSIGLVVSKTMGWVSRGSAILYSITLVASIIFCRISYVYLRGLHFDVASTILFVATTSPKPTDKPIHFHNYLYYEDFGYPYRLI